MPDLQKTVRNLEMPSGSGSIPQNTGSKGGVKKGVAWDPNMGKIERDQAKQLAQSIMNHEKDKKEQLN